MILKIPEFLSGLLGTYTISFPWSDFALLQISFIGIYRSKWYHFRLSWCTSGRNQNPDCTFDAINEFSCRLSYSLNKSIFILLGSMSDLECEAFLKYFSLTVWTRGDENAKKSFNSRSKLVLSQVCPRSSISSLPIVFNIVWVGVSCRAYNVFSILCSLSS